MLEPVTSRNMLAIGYLLMSVFCACKFGYANKGPYNARYIYYFKILYHVLSNWFMALFRSPVLK